MRGHSLIAEILCESEQEHVLLVDQATEDGIVHIAQLRVYAVEQDLYDLLPFKGDTHIHSNCSDGKEDPPVVAAFCRRIGMDFMALTDHRKYGPSLDAIAAFAGLPLDMKLFPGEEVHPPGNPVHIVNFGASRSINELFETEEYVRGVGATRAALAQSGMATPGTDLGPFASCVWCFDKIREAGGLGIFCHPYWVCNNRLDVPEYLTDLLFEHQPFGALEVTGGYHRSEVESNALQAARYYDETARGRRIPVVGASDAHGCTTGELFGWYYTIVFSRSLELEDLISSVSLLRSVAVEALPGAPVRIVGSWRLVRYAHFLVREFFPMHDELCAAEGELMLRHVRGDTSAAAEMARLQGQTASFATRCGTI